MLCIKRRYNYKNNILVYFKASLNCYGPSVISVTVTKGGHPRSNRL